MHCNPVVEFEHDEPVIHDFAASDLHIHDVVEAGVWPPALFPMGYELAVTKKIHRRLDGETNGSERELKIELTYPQLRRELPDYGRQVKLVGYPVHLRKNGCQSWQPFI